MVYGENACIEAVAWQGYDAFVGKDNYTMEKLDKGTVLVKLEPSGSGYFTTLDEIKTDNSQEISRGLQVAPRKIKFEKFYNEILRDEAEKSHLKLKELGREEDFEKYLIKFREECIKDPTLLNSNYRLRKLKELNYYRKQGHTFDKVTEHNKGVEIYEYRAFLKQYLLKKNYEMAKHKI